MPDPTPMVDWVLQDMSGKYAAPELRVFRLYGRVQSGKFVKTSRVVEVIDAITVRTESGTVYRLIGEPHEKAEHDHLEMIRHARACLKVQNERENDGTI